MIDSIKSDGENDFNIMLIDNRKNTMLRRMYSFIDINLSKKSYQMIDSLQFAIFYSLNNIELILHESKMTIRRISVLLTIIFD